MDNGVERHSILSCLFTSFAITLYSVQCATDQTVAGMPLFSFCNKRRDYSKLPELANLNLVKVVCFPDKTMKQDDEQLT